MMLCPQLQPPAIRQPEGAAGSRPAPSAHRVWVPGQKTVLGGPWAPQKKVLLDIWHCTQLMPSSLCWPLDWLHCQYKMLNPFVHICQSSGAVWKSRWLSWAPIPNKPMVSVDIKQHSTKCTFEEVDGKTLIAVLNVAALTWWSTTWWRCLWSLWLHQNSGK